MENCKTEIIDGENQHIEVLYTREEQKQSRDVYIKFFKPNCKDEKMLMVLSHCESHGTKSLPHLWFKNGYTDREINKYLTCNCYVDLPDGSCLEKYNPHIIGGPRPRINFDWLLEDTEENIQKFIAEVAKRFYKAE